MTFRLAAIVFLGAGAFSAVLLTTLYRALRDRVESTPEEEVAVSPMRKFITPRKLLTLRFCLAASLVVLGVFALLAGGVVSPALLVALGTAFGIAGWKLPQLWFGFKIKKRKEMFDAQILNLTMTLANGLRSGQALPQALDAASHRLPDPMKEELSVVMRESRLGLDLPEALERLYQRMPGEDLRLLITSIRLTLQAGGSLADVLERMVGMIRSRTEFQEKLKTMTAQGRFEAIAMSLAPVVVYILLRLIDPELMKPLTTTAIGWCTIAGVAVMLTIGFLVINKIVTIEV